MFRYFKALFFPTLFTLSTCFANVEVSREVSRSRDVHLPSEEEVSRITHLVGLAFNGKYPGTNHTRKVRHGSLTVPVWNQRTAILYYNRKNVGEPIIWLALAMGVVGNAKDLVSNKKTWMNVWEHARPTKFHEMDVYLPRTWSDADTFNREMEDDGIYVYKPVYGYQGRGITFRKGFDMKTKISDEDGSDWIVQEFVESFLYNGRKNHMRVISLIIVQPDGSREFFIYKRMRLYTAPQNYDENRLFRGEDVSDMLITNLRQSENYFKSNPANIGKTFPRGEYIFDAQTALESSDSDVSFDHVFSESMRIHEVIYSVIGDVIECKPTDISIYDDACFHMMASDVTFNRKGKPHLLEMNHRMGFNVLWSPEEQLEFSNGVAALVKNTASPYTVEDSSMWKMLDV